MNKQEYIDRLREHLTGTTKTKKHSSYQILPERLRALIGATDLEIHSKYEHERLDYMRSKVNFKTKTVLDIGCNTGFFLFEIVALGAKQAIGYEGGKVHFAFVDTAVKALGEEDKISVYERYYDFTTSNEKHDVALLLNVVHHTGDDYGNSALAMAEAKSSMINQIKSMAKHAETLIFQMGFNWKGDITKCLFDKGSKAEMIDFIAEGTKGTWHIEHVGIAQRDEHGVVYHDMNPGNIDRDDSLGEFLNRPIFILTKA